MRIDILTLFPEMLAGPFDHSIIGRARESGAVEIALHNPRDWAADKHAIVDDYAYGGGPGMVLKPEPLFACVEAVRAMAQPPGKVVLLTPQGRLLDQRIVKELAAEPRLIIICGHYEGVDERVRAHLADDEISVGDYVLSGGEPAAVVLVDAVARQLPGVLGSEHSLTEESHAEGLLEYPQYTRPAEFRGMAVPPELLSGHHEEIARWRRRRSIERTARRRPDMLARAHLTPEEHRIAEEALGEHTPDARLFRVTLPVSDIEAGARFYARLVGDDGRRVEAGVHRFWVGAAVVDVTSPRDPLSRQAGVVEPARTGAPGDERLGAAPDVASPPDPLSRQAGVVEPDRTGAPGDERSRAAPRGRAGATPPASSPLTTNVERGQGGEVHTLTFAVSDIRAMFERARAADCAWVEPKIRRRASGERSFLIRDPFGNTICFVEEASVKRRSASAREEE